MSDPVSLLWQLLVAAPVLLAAMIVLVIVVVVTRRHPYVLVIPISGYAAVNWEWPQPPPLTSLAGFSVYGEDLIVLVMALATALSLLNRTRLGLSVPLLVITLLFVASAVIGIIVLTPAEAIVEARPAIAAVLALAWAASVDWRSSGSVVALQTTVATSALLVCAVAAVHVAANGLGDASSFVTTASGQLQTSRPLTAPQAIFLACCAILLLTRGTRSSRVSVLVGTLSALTVIASSQRTAIIALALALTVLAFRAHFKPAARVLVRLLIVTASLGAVVLILGTQAGISSFTDEGTYDDRLGGWQSLIIAAIQKGPYTVVFGAPFGSGFGRYSGAGIWVEYAPHNWYVTAFLRTGILGVVILLATLVWLVRTATRRHAPLWALPVVVVLIIFGWSYSWTWFLTVFVGIAASLSSKHGTLRAAVDPTHHVKRTMVATR